MDIFIGGRQSGKTSHAIELANREDAYLAVQHRQRVYEVAERCKRFPVTYHELMEQRRGCGFCNRIVIDNAEDLIEYVLAGRFEIKGMTINVGNQ